MAYRARAAYRAVADQAPVACRACCEGERAKGPQPQALVEVHLKRVPQVRLKGVLKEALLAVLEVAGDRLSTKQKDLQSRLKLKTSLAVGALPEVPLGNVFNWIPILSCEGHAGTAALDLEFLSRQICKCAARCGASLLATPGSGMPLGFSGKAGSFGNRDLNHCSWPNKGLISGSLQLHCSAGLRHAPSSGPYSVDATLKQLGTPQSANMPTSSEVQRQSVPAPLCRGGWGRSRGTLTLDFEF